MSSIGGITFDLSGWRISWLPIKLNNIHCAVDLPFSTEWKLIIPKMFVHKEEWVKKHWTPMVFKLLLRYIYSSRFRTISYLFWSLTFSSFAYLFSLLVIGMKAILELIFKNICNWKKPPIGFIRRANVWYKNNIV